MPNDYGVYSEFIKDFKRVYQDNDEWQQSRINVNHVVPPYTKWKTTDLIDLAEKHTNFYNQIGKIVRQANSGSPTDKNTKDARKALGAIAPNGVNWEEFACMAATAQNILNGGAERVESTDQGIYKARASLIKGVYQNDFIRKRDIGPGYHLNGDYNTWTDTDLKAMAASRNAKEYVGWLNYIATDALKKDAQGHYYSKEALQAQNALATIAPKGKSWAEYRKMISDVCTEFGIKTASIAKDLSGDIALNQLDNPNFDHQKALSGLEMQQADHGQKKPIETAVTEAVKGIKSSISLAA